MKDVDDPYHDVRYCPSCDEEMRVMPGQDSVTCPNQECEKGWIINYDYSFEEGRWRDCTTISEDNKKNGALPSIHDNAP